MKYFFEAWMFRNGDQSTCYSGSENMQLSQQDIEGIKRLYPHAPAAIETINKQRSESLQQLKNLRLLPESHLQHLQ